MCFIVVVPQVIQAGPKVSSVQSGASSRTSWPSSESRSAARAAAARGSASTGTPLGASSATRTGSRPGPRRTLSANGRAGAGSQWRSPAS